MQAGCYVLGYLQLPGLPYGHQLGIENQRYPTRNYGILENLADIQMHGYEQMK